MSLIIAGGRSSAIEPIEPPGGGTMEHEELNGRRGIGADGQAWHLDTDLYQRVKGSQFYRGVFNTPEDLRAAFPKDEHGAYAIVLSTGTTWVWSVNELDWVNTSVATVGGGVPVGGATGQILTKKSDVDNDVHWADPPTVGLSYHNDLRGLQGGGATERYHLNKEQYDKVVSGKISWEDIENIPPGTTDTPGILRIATVPEVMEGIDNTTAVSPFGLQMKISALLSSQLSQDKINAINGANAPSADNVFATMKDINKSISDVLPRLMPAGGIIMWSGMLSDIPSGWALCDGTNGTPDLKDKFIIGASSSFNPGQTGGENDKVLTVSNIPSHNHQASGGSHAHVMGHSHNTSGMSTNSAGGHTHTLSGTAAANGGLVSYESLKIRAVSASGQVGNMADGLIYGPGYKPFNDYPSLIPNEGKLQTAALGNHAHNLSGSVASSGAHVHNVSGSIDAFNGSTDSATPIISVGSTGNSVPFDNRPAFYALAFIMKLQGE